jgi:MFS family permease
VTARRTLFLLSLAELFSMSLWFAGTAVLPQLAAQWHAGLNVTAWLTLAVQIGFVAGALLSAIFNLSDVLHAPRLCAISALLGAIFNAAFALTASRSITSAIVFRFLTGFVIAGIYPPGMKIVAGWYRSGRGQALGILIGALAVGNAVPHAALALGLLSSGRWQAAVLASSGLALVAALLFLFGVHDGPYSAPSQRFDFSQISAALRNRRLRLANFGYLGHMWELYSLWGWVAVLLAAAAKASHPLRPEVVRAWAFSVMAIGFFGCWWAGAASDKAKSATHEAAVQQRSWVTIISMVASGACCILAGIFFRNFPALVIISLVWGVSVIADSAQFSAIISEVADSNYIGTALTLQTALGFLLTVAAIRVTASIAEHWGWSWAAASMAVGPLFGTVAMIRLRLRPAE